MYAKVRTILFLPRRVLLTTFVSDWETLALLDLLIATHAARVGAVLVSNDHAFRLVRDLKIEDWTLSS